MKKTICIDFDGVIHSYISGWQGATVIQDPIMFGAKEAIDELAKSFEIVIYTTRANTIEGKRAVKKWLVNRNVYYDKIEGKPIAVAYIDDRAVRYNTWYGALETILDVENDSIEDRSSMVKTMAVLLHKGAEGGD